MAIIIEKAKITNTDIELSNVYGRVSFNAMPDGEKATANMTCYTSKAEYELSKAPTFKHKQVNVEVPYSFSLSFGADENQDLKVVHEKVVAELESKGFKASSDLTEELV